LRFEPTNSEALSLADSISQILESQKTDQLSAGNDVGNVISSGGIIEVQEASSTAGQSSKEPSNNGIGSSSSSSSSSSAEDESEQLKTLGNDAMKVQNYADAVRFYTQAIQKNPSNILAVSNRSQAFLKLSKYEEAIKDATEVINFVDQNISSSSTSNGSTNATNATKAKALFRRGSAYRGINTTDSLQLALLDFSNLLALEPNNKEAASEKLRTEKLVKERQQVQSTVKSDKKKSTASEVSSSPSPAPSLSSSSSSFAPGMTEVKSVRKAATASSDDKPIASAVKGEEPFAQENKAQEASKPDTSAPSKKKPVSSGRASIPVKEPSLPSELPKTVYELERVWRGLKSRPDLFVQYVSSFKKNTFKKVFTDSASPDLLSSVFLAMNEHLIRSDISEISETNVNDAVHILSGLGGINKFDLTLSLLPEEDIANIKSVLNKLSGTSFVDKSLIERLRELYKV
jgi:tetratricopeptide (TPR) repeat protein